MEQNFAKIITLQERQVIVYKRNETRPLVAIITRAGTFELKAEVDFDNIEWRDAFYEKFDSVDFTKKFIGHCFGGAVETQKGKEI
ncbi:MAG: hypothetical protein PHE56_06730 [Bacteroidales bacterium]|nr:hypothetical protein [Bacteroidales bacterium]